jgi:hypothetical protein
MLTAAEIVLLLIAGQPVRRDHGAAALTFGNHSAMADKRAGAIAAAMKEQQDLCRSMPERSRIRLGRRQRQAV